MMRIFRLLLLMTFSILVVSILCKGTTYSQNILDKEVNVNFLEASPIEILRFLSENYNIYTGIETITYDDNKVDKTFLPINIKCVKCSVKDVLTLLVTSDNRYIWNYVDNTVNVAPKDSSDRVADTYIKDFQVNKKELEEIKSYFFGMPEINEVIRKRSLTPLILMSSGILGIKGEGISLSSRSTTWQKILNELLRKGGIKHWSIYKTKKQVGYITLTL